METQVINVTPDQLLANANSRFGLRKPRIEQLKQAILAAGEVIVPLDVEQLNEPVNGFEYRILDGHYRHAAATALNKEQNAGLTLPIRIGVELSNVDRLKRQVTINLDREDPSPMDMAVAIKGLLDEGVSRQEIRSLFRRSGGRKGTTVQDASNSYLNMTVSFLAFPKKIQSLIHERVMGTLAAYNLSKKPKEDWDEIIQKALQAREAEVEAEEKMEEKLLDVSRKEEESKAKVEQLAKDKEAAELKAKQSYAALDKANDVEMDKFKATKQAKDDAEKKAAEDAFKAAQLETKAATKAAEDAKKEADKYAEKLDKVKAQAAERAKKLADARKVEKKAEKKDKGITAKHIEKAAGGLKKLSAPEMREAVKEWALPGSLPKVAALAAIIMKCFDSELTPSQAYTEMGKITGESSKNK